MKTGWEGILFLPTELINPCIPPGKINRPQEISASAIAHFPQPLSDQRMFSGFEQYAVKGRASKSFRDNRGIFIMDESRTLC